MDQIAYVYSICSSFQDNTMIIPMKLLKLLKANLIVMNLFQGDIDLVLKHCFPFLPETLTCIVKSNYNFVQKQKSKSVIIELALKSIQKSRHINRNLKKKKIKKKKEKSD